MVDLDSSPSLFSDLQNIDLSNLIKMAFVDGLQNEPLFITYFGLTFLISVIFIAVIIGIIIGMYH